MSTATAAPTYQEKVDSATAQFVAFYQKHPDKVTGEFDFFGNVGGVMADFIHALRNKDIEKARAVYRAERETLTGNNPTEDARLSALIQVVAGQV